MALLKIHGFVQIRSKNRSKHTRGSQWKEAVIETVERKQKASLVVSFKLEGRRRVFPLGGNVAGVVVSYCEAGLHRLHLTLKDDTSLLIDKLSASDVEQLKSVLDSVHPSESQQLEEPERNQDVLESGDLFCRKHQDTFCGSLNITQESETLFPMNMSLSMANSASGYVEEERAEKQNKKRKTISTSTVELNEVFLKENNSESRKKSKSYNSRNKRNKGEKLMTLRDQEMHNNWKLEPLFSTNSCGKLDLDDTVFASGSKFSQEIPIHNDIQSPLDTCAKQLTREGFPNLGNTCYMNSILQSVFGIPTFAKDLLTQGIPWEKVSCDDLIKPLSQLLVLKDIRDVEIKGQLLINVKKSISTVADTFLGDEQNDAHEFLSQCLDQLKLNVEKLNAMCCTERENEVDDFFPPTYAGPASTKMFVCPVSANFEIELDSSIVCEACGEATLNTEVSNYLSVDLHQGTKEHPLSIQKSLDLFFTPEKIERNCEKCKNKNSVLRYTLRRLPRVLILHLKRYHFTANRLLVKSQQPVEISKYLDVSSHCNENTKPPFPLTSQGPHEAYDVPNVSEEMMPDILSQSIPAKRVTSDFIDFTVLQVGSSEDAEVQTLHRMYEELSEEQWQRGLENGPKVEPKAAKRENRMLSEKTLPAPDSMICEPISIHIPGLAEMGLQQVSKNSEFKKYEKINVYGKSDHYTTTEMSNYLCDLKEQNILDGSQEIAEQLLQIHGSRIHAELLPWASPQSVRSTEEDTGARNTDAESKNAAMGDDPQNYRLVGVVSHFGSSQDSGHYVSDVYDFQRQAWLLYSDVQVFEIPEALIQENRLHTGYIFFYMRNEIFDWLLKKASECKLLNTSQDEKNTELFSTLLNGFTYLLEES
nr:ubiquitin carboxyl-terminal hydrolase 29-like [Myodes glareolus]